MSRKPHGANDPEALRLQAPRLAIAILGAPVEAGAGVPGSAMGPATLRTAGIVKSLRDLGHDVEDRATLPFPIRSSTPPPPKARRIGSLTSPPGRDCWRARPTR